MTAAARLMRLAVGGLVVGGALGVLHLLGVTSSAPPTDLSAARGWLEDHGPIEAAFALVRLLGIGLGWYLVATTVVGGLARFTRRPGLVALIDLATLPVVRRALGGLLGIGLSAAGLEPGPAPQDHTAEMRVIDDDDHTAEMRVLDPPSTRAMPPPAAQTWTTAPGDHLWSIAEATLADAWRRAPSEAEVADYWQVLVADNRDRLVVPTDPDLIFAGQLFHLPTVPAA